MHKLREFLENGRLAPIAIGLSPDEVQLALGQPLEVGGTPKQRIGKYGSMQFGFRRDPALRTEVVSFIGLYFHSGSLDLPEVIVAGEWFPPSHATKEEVIHYLEDQDVPYSRDKRLTFETQFALATPCGASIIFDCSEGEWILDSIQLLREPQSCPL